MILQRVRETSEFKRVTSNEQKVTPQKNLREIINTSLNKSYEHQ